MIGDKNERRCGGSIVAGKTGRIGRIISSGDTGKSTKPRSKPLTPKPLRDPLRIAGKRCKLILWGRGFPVFPAVYKKGGLI